MEQACMICKETKDSQVPKLTCGHYICPPCYVLMKSQKKACLVCQRVMIRRCNIR